MAYSMAVMEARALNYYAASNRAIAASYVAMTSMHAYLASASSTWTKTIIRSRGMRCSRRICASLLARLRRPGRCGTSTVNSR